MSQQQYHGYPNPDYEKAGPSSYLKSLHELKVIQNNVYKNLEERVKTGKISEIGRQEFTDPNVNNKMPTTNDNEVLKEDVNDNLMNEKFTKVQRLRKELDEKLTQLYFTENSILSDSKMEYDTAIYTGVLWTVLASCVVYYIFVKL